MCDCNRSTPPCLTFPRRCSPLQEAYDAYRSLFSGQIAMGVEVANEAWGGNVISLDEVRKTANYIKARGGNGMMLWVRAGCCVCII